MATLQSRRDFLVQSALTTAGLSLGLNALAHPLDVNPLQPKNANPLKISVFSKNLQWLDYKQMAEQAAAMGFDGVDLTVRPKGHVLPERVETDLPKAVELIRKQGLDVYMITTAIYNASEPYTERIIKTASQLGIKTYRLGWFSYIKTQSILQNIKTFNTTLLQLQQLNERYNIQAAYQNHAGESFGSPVLDFAMALDQIKPEWISSQYDIRHATVEGANSWPIGLNMVQDYVRSVNIKDFKWSQQNGRWNVENVPLGEGMVNFPKYFELLKSYNFNGPVCIHYEYALGGAEEGASTISIAPTVVYEAMRKDLKQLKQWLKIAGFVQ